MPRSSPIGQGETFSARKLLKNCSTLPAITLYWCDTAPDTMLMLSTFTMPLLSTPLRSFGRATWVARKTRNCCSITLIARFGCSSPTTRTPSYNLFVALCGEGSSGYGSQSQDDDFD